MRVNEFNQQIGDAVDDPTPGRLPDLKCLEGRFCRIEKLNPQKHLESLFNHLLGPSVAASEWTYLFLEGCSDKSSLQILLEKMAASRDPVYLCIVDRKSGEAVGMFALMRIDPQNRVIEVGSVHYGKALRRTAAATEAQYLLARYVFEDLHYRRYEWKCDSLNAPSRHAALRLGFTFEGIFRQAIVYKGRNRDTAWFSMLDREWPRRKARLESWLCDDNFDARGCQLRPLSSIPL